MACGCQQQQQPLGLRLFRESGPLPDGADFSTWSQGVQFGFELQRFEWDKIILIGGAILSVLVLTGQIRLGR